MSKIQYVSTSATNEITQNVGTTVFYGVFFFFAEISGRACLRRDCVRSHIRTTDSGAPRSAVYRAAIAPAVGASRYHGARKAGLSLWAPLRSNE